MKLDWPARLGVKTFLQRYWQKKPLLIKQAFKDFNNPLSPDELGGLALDEDINSRLILKESETRWHLRSGPFSEDELTSLPSTDWTLLVSDVEKHLDGFNQFLNFFRFIPDWRIDDLMISYAPTGASAGPHVDAYDVFLFQASGKRRWMIDASGEHDIGYLPGNELRILEKFNATEEWVLEPGDMLYLPPGVPHHGISEDDQCMTWSVGFRAPSHADLVGDIAQQITSSLLDSQDEERRYTDPNLPQQDHPGELSVDAITELRRIWDEHSELDDEQFTRMLGQALTRTPDTTAGMNNDLQSGDDNTLEDAQSLEMLKHELARDEPAPVLRNPSARMLYCKDAEVCSLYVNGREIHCSEKLAQLLTDDLDYSAESLISVASGEQDLACLDRLLRDEVLLLVDGSPG